MHCPVCMIGFVNRHLSEDIFKFVAAHCVIVSIHYRTAHILAGSCYSSTSANQYLLKRHCFPHKSWIGTFSKNSKLDFIKKMASEEDGWMGGAGVKITFAKNTGWLYISTFRTAHVHVTKPTRIYDLVDSLNETRIQSSLFNTRSKSVLMCNNLNI